jgi:hypothetical protein
MTQSQDENAFKEEPSQPPGRRWYAPQFHVLELAATALSPHGPMPDNPGHDSHLS